MNSSFLLPYQGEVKEELQRILQFWRQYAKDEQHGGFIGRMDGAYNIIPDSPKGAVLNARILWTFSSAYRLLNNPEDLAMADKAFQFLTEHMEDNTFGGVYWSVDANGNPLDTKKQVYAQAFYLYALCEYYSCKPSESLRNRCINLYQLMERYSFDHHATGYFEAFSSNWEPIADLRLSDKDANEKKTMNTHLHLIEAYCNLYRIHPVAVVKKSIQLLLQNFQDHFIDPATFHLRLFFTEDWQNKGNLVSYGHDIEAAWLLLEAAERIDDADWIAVARKWATHMTDAAAKGLDLDGGLWYEKEEEHLIQQKHWWPQAEAMVGFFNAWKVSGDEAYLEKSIKSWEFIQQHILDAPTGEWVWGIEADGRKMQHEDVIGIWKCPYHNGRACMELMQRIHQIVSLPTT